MKNSRTYRYMSKILRENGWEESWDHDNWVRSDAKNKEANTGIPMIFAYHTVIGYKPPTKRLYKIV